jgi:PGF-pre-PGF domain-containing protein
MGEKNGIWKVDTIMKLNLVILALGVILAMVLVVSPVAGADITSPDYITLAGDNQVVITLTGGDFKAAPIVAGDFTFTGTDNAIIAAGTFTRTSATVVTISCAAAAGGIDNAVVVKDATHTGAASVAAVSSKVDKTSPAYTTTAGDNQVVITLTGGTFKAAPIVAGDFTFAGTDNAIIAAGTFTRTSATVVTISCAAAAGGADNTVLVKAATQATGTATVAAVSSKVDKTSPAYTTTAGNTLVVITLTGGTFKAAPIVAGDFTFAGTDNAIIAAGTFTRTSATVVTISCAATAGGADNTVLVKAATQATGTASVAAVASTPAAPTFTSATTSTAGSTITITFNKAMANPAGKHGEFSYKVNGGTAQTFSAAALNADTTKIDLTTSGTPILPGYAITVSYTAGTVTAADTGVLASFADQSVTGIPIPPTPTPDSGNPSPAPAQATTSTSEVNVGGNSAVAQVAVTGTGINEVIVTGMVVSGPGQDNAPPAGNVFEYIEITPARYTTITEASISFSVPVAWLEANHITPQNVIMNHQAGKTWNALPTTLVKIENGIAYYTTVSPGFSLFAITGDNTTPAVAVQEQVPGNQTFGEMVQATTIPIVSPVADTPIATQTTTAAPPAPTKSPLPLTLILIGLVIASIISIRRERF